MNDDSARPGTEPGGRRSLVARLRVSALALVVANLVRLGRGRLGK